MRGEFSFWILSDLQFRNVFCGFSLIVLDESYLPNVCRINIWREPLWCNSSSLIWTNPCPEGNVFLCTNTVPRPRNTRHTELHFIREWFYGVCEPGLFVVSSSLLFLRRWRFWNINEQLMNGCVVKKNLVYCVFLHHHSLLSKSQ